MIFSSFWNHIRSQIISSFLSSNNRRDSNVFHYPKVPSNVVSSSSFSSDTTDSIIPFSSQKSSLKLLDLPDDILWRIIRHTTHSDHENPGKERLQVVEEISYANAIQVAFTCKKLATLFYASLDNVCLSSSKIEDSVVDIISRKASINLKRIVLRGCNKITNYSLYSLVECSPHLRSIDLSFVSTIDDDGISSLCTSLSTRLRKLLLRKCEGIGDRALQYIGQCKNLGTLDLSYCPQITDRGMFHVLNGCGQSLRLLAIAKAIKLTDKTFFSIAQYCPHLWQLCSRGLPLVTDLGFSELCQGIGESAEGIDVTDCTSLSRDATLRALQAYCKNIYPYIMPNFAAKSLRQIIISTLRQNIFIVQGSDPVTDNNTVHTVLIDNGDLVSASLLGSGTTDLSMLGIVLCKSYGSGLDDDTKIMLENDYGISTNSLI